MICTSCGKKSLENTSRCPFCGAEYEAASNETFSSDFYAYMDRGCLHDFHVKNIDLDFDPEAEQRFRIAFGIEKQARDGMEESAPIYSKEDFSTIIGASDTDEAEAPPEPTEKSPEEEHENKLEDVLGVAQKAAGAFNWKLMVKLGIIIILLLTVLFGCSKAMYFLGVWQPFESYMVKQDYNNANLLYEDCTDEKFRKDANAYIEGELKKVVQDYGAGTITGAEAQRKLDGLSLIYGDPEYVSSFYTRASEIQSSKVSYTQGVDLYEAGDYAGAMDCFSKISPLDSESSTAIKNAFADSSIMESFRLGLKQTGEEDPATAMQGMLYMQAFLTDPSVLDSDIEDLSRRSDTQNNGLFGGGNASGSHSEDEKPLFSEPVVINKNSPIYISEIKTLAPSADGGIDLIIRWVNRSGKTIENITFCVEPSNEYGHVLSCRQQKYSLFNAVDRGPYENGQGTPTETWMWRNAWYNSLIRRANLLSVTIEYEGGSKQVLKTEAEINSVFSK